MSNYIILTKFKINITIDQRIIKMVTDHWSV